MRQDLKLVTVQMISAPKSTNYRKKDHDRKTISNEIKRIPRIITNENVDEFPSEMDHD